MIDKLGTITKGTIEASVTVGQGHVQKKVQIEIALGVSNVKSTTILQKTAKQHKQTERQNKFSNCLIWMKIKLYYIYN